MKCEIEIIVGVILRKPVVKVEIEAFWIAILTLTAGDGLSRNRGLLSLKLHGSMQNIKPNSPNTKQLGNIQN
jgi:hypothetical protein